jgi:hypothetical protein
MLFNLNYSTVINDFNWVIRILNSVDDENQMKVVSKCFELWEAKHIKNGMSKVEKSFINDLRKKYWSIFKNKNSRFLVSSYF